MTTDYSDNSDGGGGGVQTSDAHRPGSRLKANIDELDTLLSDLNNAQNTRSTSSADDYGDQNHLQGHVKKTVHSMSTANEYSTNTSSEYNRQKPPSPSPTRRNRTPVMMPSPVPPARRTSPSPARRTSPPRGQSPPRKQRSPSPLGHAYYSKYHSTYSSSQNNTPVSFPTCPSPSPNRGPNLQTPPKKVDDLMTELREFDPSIQHVTSFTEPSTITTTTTHHKSHKHTAEEDSHLRQRRREPSPICSPKQPSTPGPAVYYPPGELFSSTRNDDIIMPAASGTGRGETDHATLDTTTSSNGARAAKVRAEYGYKSGRYQEAESNKQGAAVVPICLPLCCAAPCVIL